MSTINETGFLPDSLDDILTAYIIDLKAAHGENVRSDAQSVFGQLLRLFGLSVAELNELAEFILQAYNPQTATGVSLSSLVLMAGIQRQESAFSTVTLTCGATSNGVTIPAGSQVKDPNASIVWATNAQVIVASSSTNTVTATAIEAGAKAAAAGTVTKIETPVFGWSTVTNASAANLGQTEETDSALRLRFQTTVDSGSTVSDGKRFQAVSDVSGVDSVIATSNNGTVTDSDGVPPQHVWTIVDGGTNALIAQAIYEHTAGGIGYYGSTTVSYQDPDNLAFYDIKFTRPSDISVYVSCTLVTNEDFPIDGAEQVDAAIIAYINALQLDDDVIVSRLYTPINSIPGHYVSALTVGFSSSPTLSANLSIAKDERAVTDTAKVVITS